MDSLPPALKVIAEERWSKIEAVLNNIWAFTDRGSATLPVPVEDYMATLIIISQWTLNGLSSDDLTLQANPIEMNKQILTNQITLNVVEFLKSQTHQLENLPDITFINNYLQKFEYASKSARTVKNLCNPIERFASAEAKRPVTVILHTEWKNILWDPYKSKILKILLNSVKAGRNGEVWDRSLLRKTREMLVVIGESLSTVSASHGKLTLYDHDLFQPFLNETVDFYITESMGFLSENTVVDYMALIVRRLEQELSLGQQCLDPNSCDKLIKTVEDALIKQNIEALKMEFRQMLHNEQEDEMRMFHSILKRVPDGLKEAAVTFGEKLISDGKNITSSQEALLTDRKALANSVELVNRIIALHSKYLGIIRKCFNNELIFQQSMDKQFTTLLNANVGIFSIPEILSFYVDKQLRDMKLEEGAVEQAFDSIVGLVIYLFDKDMFEKSCIRALMKRLLSPKFNETREAAFISKLKQKCGDSLTRVMEDMINDIRVSEEHSSAFNSWLKEQYPKVSQSVSVKVLNSHRWGTLPRMDIQLLDEWVPLVEAFTDWYVEKYPVRKLAWNYHSGQATVTNYYLDKNGTRRTCEIQVTLLQASILFLFNSQTTLTFGEIFEKLGLSDSNILMSAIAPLVYFKIPMLVRKPAAISEEGSEPQKSKEEEIILPTDTFIYKPLTAPPKTSRFAYPPMTASAIKKEMANSKAQVEAERLAKLDLAIVRTMKAHNVLHYNEIIARVSEQVSQFFVAEPRLIKQQIHSLIERGYIKRDENDFAIFHYVA